ncbi:MAG: TolC family protein, partial [Phycisphaerae bacterium]|nr:TolC family protein [Phycisphaerae bacterium]
TELETIVRTIEERQGVDIQEVQVKLARARYENRKNDFVQAKAQVMDAEDNLKALMNDPDVNLAKDLEIIPTDVVNIEPLIVDVYGEMAAALEYRSELRQARLQIDQAKIAIGVAKNQALPKLDLTFRYVIDGLGGNWGKAFSQMCDNDFNEYMLQLQFEWPIGARAGEAQIRQARLQQAQAIAQHRGRIEQVILETKTAIRDLHTAYDQIGPSLRSAQASQAQLTATKLRQERKDLPSLQVELDAHESLAASRQNLVRSIADYNVAIINLERRKGTLLSYNNIVLNPNRDNSVFTQPPATMK